jgi:ParB family chromosome partitioning protein
VFDQVTENDHREALTVAERVAAYEHLAAFGVGAAQIAKGMAWPPAARRSTAR